jgi:molybdopterin molybdotransferase
MISVEEAQELILNHTSVLKTEKIKVDDSIGRVLRQNILADRNQPPFNRVAMDGIAINTKSLSNKNLEYRIEGIQAAGSEIKTLNNLENCLEAMTGAVLPNNTDAIIRYEDLKIEKGKASIVEDLTISKMKNVHIEGADHKKGDILLKPYTKITSNHMAVLASCGVLNVEVSANPKIAIISTGSELVDIDKDPLPHQIRKSNAYTLKAELQMHGFTRVKLFHFTDDMSETLNGLKSVLNEFSTVILSGGVSMGKYDYVPSALTELKVKKIFHKIKQKPGKPFWFGKGEDEQSVFALPGNPVSCLVCLRRYVLPALYKSIGLQIENESKVIISESYKKNKKFTHFIPVKLQNINAMLYASPISTNGSGDYFSLSDSDGFISFDEDRLEFNRGELVSYYKWGSCD